MKWFESDSLGKMRKSSISIIGMITKKKNKKIKNS